MTCYRCGAPATCEFSFDLDLRPFGSCEGCKERVRDYLTCLLTGDKKLADIVLDRPKRVSRA